MSPVTGRQVCASPAQMFVFESTSGVKSQPLTVGVELRKTCVLSPLLFIVYMNWDDSYRRVDEDATVRSCRINRLIFAHDLVLLASCILNGVFHIHLIGFLLRATKWG